MPGPGEYRGKHGGSAWRVGVKELERGGAGSLCKLEDASVPWALDEETGVELTGPRHRSWPWRVTTVMPSVGAASRFRVPRNQGCEQRGTVTVESADSIR